MKKNHLSLLPLMLVLFIFTAFSFKKNQSDLQKVKEDREWCYEIRCTGKSWYKEKSPKFTTISQANDYMENKYKGTGCSVYAMRDGACD